MVNLGILDFCILDSWKMYKRGLGSRRGLQQAEYYGKLKEALIENDADVRHVQSRGEKQTDEIFKSLKSGRSTYQAPPKKRRVVKGTTASYAIQGRCRTCGSFNSSLVCTSCRKADGIECFLCHGRTSRDVLKLTWNFSTKQRSAT